MTPRRVWGIAGILLALVCGVAAMMLAVSGFGSQAVFSSASPATVNVEAGSWTVFELAPEDSVVFTPSAVAELRTIDSGQITVVGPAGTPVPTTCGYCNSEGLGPTPVDLRMANPIVTFDARQSGAYTITVKASNSGPIPMAVANPMAKLTELMPWLSLLVFLGAALGTAGLILIIVGGGRSGSTTPTRPPVAEVPPAVPPGWYPNPYRPDAGEMWWDGTKWTSNWR